MAIKFEDVQNLAPVVQGFATAAGIIVGGVWVYLKFIRERVYRPRPHISIQAGKVTHLGKNYLLCDLAVQNIGTVQVGLSQKGTWLRLFEGELPPKSFRELKWTRRRTLAIFEEHAWIETRETIRQGIAVALPDGEGQHLLLEVRLACEWRGGRNIVVLQKIVLAPNDEWQGPRGTGGGTAMSTREGDKADRPGREGKSMDEDPKETAEGEKEKAEDKATE